MGSGQCQLLNLGGERDYAFAERQLKSKKWAWSLNYLTIRPKVWRPEPVFSLSATLVSTDSLEVKTCMYTSIHHRKEKTRGNANRLFGPFFHLGKERRCRSLLCIADVKPDNYYSLLTAVDVGYQGHLSTSRLLVPGNVWSMSHLLPNMPRKQNKKSDPVFQKTEVFKTWNQVMYHRLDGVI